VALAVPGFRAAGVSCGIKAAGELDLALIASDRPATAAAVFTTSRFPGAPVVLSRRNLRNGSARAIVVNSGISNVATGERGVEHALRMSRAAARVIGARPTEISVASTGVIGRWLPIEQIEEGIEAAGKALSAKGFTRAARAILTTDTKPKLAEHHSRDFSMLGLTKGAGMVQPNMATMLGYIVTDLAVEKDFLKGALQDAVDASFNRLTIDGETSTSDTVVVLANGAAGNRPVGSRSPKGRAFARALADVSAQLTEKLAWDGEGVTRLADVIVTGARKDADAEKIARSIANSVLVKTAIFGADPNWGRIVQAAGAAGVPLRPDQFSVRIAGVEVIRAGQPAGGDAMLKRAERAARKKRIAIEVSLGKGSGRARVLTTDLTYEYVRINAEYTT
jgi:glutamate N-acetyltransferase/amino-acid N-acetyltransferase